MKSLNLKLRDMTIDKWASNKNYIEEKKKKDKIFKTLPKEKVQDLKKEGIRKIIQPKKKDKSEEQPSNTNLLDSVVEFKNWLNSRTYLKGDLDKIEAWILNLSRMITSVNAHISNLDENKNKKQAIERYKEIPIKFLDEKTRIALNKKIRGAKKTSSDNYYLRKLKIVIKEKLKESEYYEILKSILEF
jgi:hypothetical protein